MQEACIPKQIVGLSYICKVGIVDNKNGAFLILPPFPLSSSSLSFSWCSIISPSQGSVKWCVWLFSFLNQPFLLCQRFLTPVFKDRMPRWVCFCTHACFVLCVCWEKMPLYPTSRCYIVASESDTTRWQEFSFPAAHFFFSYPLSIPHRFCLLISCTLPPLESALYILACL